MKSPRRQDSQCPQCPPCHPTPTRSPTFHGCVSAPTASITPAISCPGERGYTSPGKPPSLVKTSLWQIPHACILILTDRCAGSCVGSSNTSKLPPARVTRTAFIGFLNFELV